MANIAMTGAISALTEAIRMSTNLANREGSLVSITEELRSLLHWLKGASISYYCEQKGFGEKATEVLTDAEALAYDVNDSLEKYLPRIALWQGGTTGMFDKVFASHNFAGEIKGLKNRARDLYTVRHEVELAAHISSCDEGDKQVRMHFPSDDELPRIVGFEEHIKRLEDDVLDAFLRGERSKIIAIVGMAGVGKTTLAKIVYTSVRHKFDCSAMIRVPKSPNVRQLLQDIAEQVSSEKYEEEQLIENLLANLSAHFKGKRCLIFLDDIWKSQDLHHTVFDILNKHANYSRIIITSRKRKMVRPMRFSSLHELQPLNENDSWGLFSRMVTKPLKINHKLESLGKEIVEKCGGVPLAIVAAADLLQGREMSEHEWQRVLETMGQSDNDMCSRALDHSYEDLPVHLKPCLLYFGLLQKDYDHFASEIINVWIAERFVQGEEKLEPEDVGMHYLDHLAGNSLIQVSTRRFDGRIRTFHVHEIVHSFCIWKATATNFFTNLDTPMPATGGVQYTTINSGSSSRQAIILNTFPSTGGRRVTTSDWGNISLHSATLQTVVCFQECATPIDETKQVEKFSEGFRSLRVLVVGSNQLPSFLTKGLGNSTLLRYLGSRENSWPPRHVKLPSNIGNLKGLLTLDLRNVVLQTLPEGIWKMAQLRHILLRKPTKTMSRTDARKGKHRLRRIEVYLPNLQTLYVAPGDIFQAGMLQTFTKLRKLGIARPTKTTIELLMNLENPLHNLEILWLSCEKLEMLNLSPCASIRRLHLKVHRFDGMTLPPNLVKLVLMLEEMIEDPMEKLKELKKLKVLKLYADETDNDEFICSGGPDAFPELEVFELYLPFSICKLKVDEQAMPRLKKLSGLSSQMLLEVPERIRKLCVKRAH